MLVDVVELRRNGERLPKDVVKGAKPVRGRLQMSGRRAGWYPGKKNPPLLAMLISEQGFDSFLAPLDWARVTRIRSGAMLLVGIQQHVQHRRIVEDWPQAWWVRTVMAMSNADER